MKESRLDLIQAIWQGLHRLMRPEPLINPLDQDNREKDRKSSKNFQNLYWDSFLSALTLYIHLRSDIDRKSWWGRNATVALKNNKEQKRKRKEKREKKKSPKIKATNNKCLSETCTFFRTTQNKSAWKAKPCKETNARCLASRKLKKTMFFRR